MNFNNFKNNFFEVFSNFKYIIIFLITFFSVGFIFYTFLNFELIYANFGPARAYTESILSFLITFLFAVFVPISIYKFFKFSSISFKENSTSIMGTLFGVVVAGCPACSITLASYLGLASFFSFFPYYGLELKFISAPMLIYANYSILNSLNTCKIQKKNLN